MKTLTTKRLVSGRRGAAMTETALLCFFIYVPVLMMVIVWGDMTLDKERAHAAAAYMAFREESVDTAALRNQFFPGSGGGADPTGSVRTVEMDPSEDDRAEPGPEFELPGSQSGDYSGEPPEFDLQYKLYSLAVGNAHVTRELQPLPDGGIGFVSRVERIRTDVSDYLIEHGIVRFSGWDEAEVAQELGEAGPDDMLQIDTGFSSRDYTEYVRTLTDVFNGQWGVMDNTMPRRESMAALETTFRSPFLWELERQETSPARGRSEEPYLASGPLPRVGGEPGFRMRFGPGEERELADDSFETGYTYLRNSDARPDADQVWEDVHAVSPDLFDYPATGVRMADMGNHTPLTTERTAVGEADMVFLNAGDPRPTEDDEED